MSCNLGKTGTRFTVFLILFWFLVEHFKLSARTKDARDTRDAFLEIVYPCIIEFFTLQLQYLQSCNVKPGTRQNLYIDNPVTFAQR